MAEVFEVNQCINKNLANFVLNSLPSTLDNDLDKAIAIYTTLCRVLKYDVGYTVYGDIAKTNDICDVTVSNNEVVAYQFAHIYYQLLLRVGVRAKIHSTSNGNMYVTFNYQGVMYSADPTRCGHYEPTYYMSDFTNAKYGSLLFGLRAIQHGDERDTVEVSNKTLRKKIREVYTKLGLPNNGDCRINETLSKIYERENQRGSKFDGKRINRMIDSINFFTFLDNCDVENGQLLNKLTASLFADIYDDRFEIITLYKETEKGVRVTRLVVAYDEEMVPYYNLLIGKKLFKMNVTQLYEYLVKEGWYFRNPPDIDALNIDDMDMIRKLYK